MTHDEIKKNLSAYHDGELPFLEMLAVKTHLAVCAECFSELSRLRDLDALLTPAPAVTEQGFEAAVMARIIDHDPETDARALYTGWWKVPALALASCAGYAVCVETGLLPAGYDPLASALAAQSEAQKLSSVLFGNSRAGSEQMLAMLLDGDKK
ncbi:MAG TPA: hypothetical protein DCZ92_06815 [Elusimicrobia bacterium]|nr:MAG: hypothetical protein A2016_05150 [Elusimicrobia bacterium GWF2_62_30]HBA60517.1 hypothetical protein [Elusimicrobiota bacterium]